MSKGYLLQLVSAVVSERFVATDAAGAVGWTRDRHQARRFATKGAADRFALNHVVGHVCSTPAS